MDSDSLGSGLTGTYLVKRTRAAKAAAHRLFPRIADYMELRAHALKLRYWPDKNPTDEADRLLDLDWGWIKSLKGANVGELRIDDAIGGIENLRVIFFVGEKTATSKRPIIWILHVLQKKRQDFASQDLDLFRLRRLHVLSLAYGR